MNDDQKSVTLVAFESAMQRCAHEAGAEPQFDRDVDGDYLQPEMRRALAGWLCAGALILDHIRGFAEFGVARFRGDAAFQSGFLQFLEHAADQLALSSDAPDSSRAAEPRQANTVIDAAVFDDAVLDDFNRALKAKMAMGRAQRHGGWWSAPVEELSAMLRAHVDKGDSRDVALLAMMLWYKDATVAPAPALPAEIVAAGELTKISSSPVMGGQLDIRTSAGPIGITGFPNELARDCKPLLWEQVEIVIRSADITRPAAMVKPESAWARSSALEWLVASRAAFQVGVDLDTVQAWAAANEIEHCEDDGTLMVRYASVLARAHRYRTGQRPVASTPGDAVVGHGHECEYRDRDGVCAESEALDHDAATIVSERKA
ncbi:hypothetical protein [Burkholderia stagnalis]|uniref:hypothetical protein n=1 Tax=Burkholderia stagnalis TaxID=1503054 RepID=UPI001639B46F|nr:hypothetical protein [Burkholderia stagnalis]